MSPSYRYLVAVLLLPLLSAPLLQIRPLRADTRPLYQISIPSNVTAGSERLETASLTDNMLDVRGIYKVVYLLDDKTYENGLTLTVEYTADANGYRARYSFKPNINIVDRLNAITLKTLGG